MYVWDRVKCEGQSRYVQLKEDVGGEGGEERWALSFLFTLNCSAVLAVSHTGGWKGSEAEGLNCGADSKAEAVALGLGSDAGGLRPILLVKLCTGETADLGLSSGAEAGGQEL